MHLLPIDLDELVGSLLGLIKRVVGTTIKVTLFASRELQPACVDAALMEEALVDLALIVREACPNGGRLTLKTANVIRKGRTLDDGLQPRAGDFVQLSFIAANNGNSRAARLNSPRANQAAYDAAWQRHWLCGAVSAVVQRHGGWLEIENCGETQVRFIVFLPARPELVARGEWTQEDYACH